MKYLIIVMLLLVGCASESGWVPTVDTSYQPQQQQYQPQPGAPSVQQGGYVPEVQQGYDPNAYNQAMVECQMLAKQASGGTFNSTITDAAGGALLGAAGGAIVGAFTGNPGTGAAIGAAAGGFGGGTYGGLSSNATYKSAFSNCLRQRGYRVLN